jgi:hypothetical protein
VDDSIQMLHVPALGVHFANRHLIVHILVQVDPGDVKEQLWGHGRSCMLDGIEKVRTLPADPATDDTL